MTSPIAIASFYGMCMQLFAHDQTNGILTCVAAPGVLGCTVAWGAARCGAVLPGRSGGSAGAIGAWPRSGFCDTTGVRGGQNPDFATRFGRAGEIIRWQTTDVPVVILISH